MQGCEISSSVEHQLNGARPAAAHYSHARRPDPTDIVSINIDRQAGRQAAVAPRRGPTQTCRLAPSLVLGEGLREQKR